MTTPDPVIEFDEQRHEYRVNGVLWPSVTQVLEGAGISDFSDVQPAVLRHSQERGTAVHRACWFCDNDDLDESSVDPEIAGYLEAWRKFKRDMHWTSRFIEQIVSCPTYHYCGTYDREGFFGDGKAALLDLKTGNETDAWPIQLAAYARMLPQPLSRDRVAVKLASDGTYRVHWYPILDFRRDEAVFLSALTLYSFKKERGIL